MSALAGSCLSDDAIAHFREREAAILEMDRKLEEKARKVLEKADLSAAAPPATASSAPADEGFHLAPAPVDEAAQAAPAQSSSRAQSAGVNIDVLHQTIATQKARIVKLQSDYEQIVTDLQEQSGTLRREREESSRLRALTEQFELKEKNWEKTNNHQKKLISTQDSKISGLEKECLALKKERDEVLAKAKRAERDTVDVVKKQNLYLADLERCRTELKQLKKQDGETHAVTRRENERLTAEVRRLERQRAELVNAFRKQQKLIDVLKRQRVHIEAARLLAFTEEEFVRVLELGDRV